VVYWYFVLSPCYYRASVILVIISLLHVLLRTVSTLPWNQQILPTPLLSLLCCIILTYFRSVTTHTLKVFGFCWYLPSCSSYSNRIWLLPNLMQWTHWCVYSRKVSNHVSLTSPIIFYKKIDGYHLMGDLPL
jgi:hypothetical protein